MRASEVLSCSSDVNKLLQMGIYRVDKENDCRCCSLSVVEFVNGDKSLSLGRLLLGKFPWNRFYPDMPQKAVKSRRLLVCRASFDTNKNQVDTPRIFSKKVKMTIYQI